MTMRSKYTLSIILYPFTIAAVAAMAVSCVDNHILPSGEGEEEVAENGIAFSSNVITSRVATRADASLVNKNEYHLPATTTGVDGNNLYVGVFGAYTGQHTWAKLKTIVAKAEGSRTTEEKAALAEHYKANFFFNQQAEVAVAAGTPQTNILSYNPLRFWPNNLVKSSLIPSRYEYASFWAYYPWNPTGDPGTNGIAIVPTANDTYSMASGMGKLKFTMQTDAKDQVDFLLSDLVADCSKDQYPLIESTVPADKGWTPKRVPFTFHHALAQVRIYAFIRCTDKIVYAKDGDKELWVKSKDDSKVTLTDGLNDYDKTVDAVDQTYIDFWGKEQTVVIEPGKKLKIPDDTWWLYDGADKAAKQAAAAAAQKTQRWTRTGTTDYGGNKYYANKKMSVAFNNIYTSAIYTLSDTQPSFTSEKQGSAVGTSTVSDYKFRHDWFLPHNTDARVMLDTERMYGIDSNGDGYGDGQPFFDRGNIMLVVPQTLTDDDVPNIVVTVTDATNAAVNARVTVNLLNLGITWESGYIYSYAIIDELQPGDDKVRGPENIIVVFNPDPTKNTDQW